MNASFHPHEPGDPAEARVVAWLHGEVSPAEAIELERLCGERPELAEFRRGLLAVHGLLASPPAADPAWKLSPERRARVEAALATPVKARHAARWVRPALLAAAACVALAAGFQFLVVPLSNPPIARKDDARWSVARAPQAAKAAGDFRRETVAGEAPVAPRVMAEPPAGTPLAPLARPADELAGDWSRDGLAAMAKQPAAPAEAPAKREFAGQVASLAGVDSAAQPSLAMAAAPVAGVEVSPWQRVDRQLRASQLLRENGVSVAAEAGGWAFRRSGANGLEILFRLAVSDAAGARAYRADGERVKLLATDEAGADCAERKLELGGKTVSVEALVRQALEK